MKLFARNLVALFSALFLSALLSLSLNELDLLPSPHWFYGVLFLFVLHFIFNLVYANMAGKESFTGLLLAGIVIKLLLTLVVILIYSFNDPAGFLNFSVQFIFHYILFTVFEIRYLLPIIKNSPTHTHHAT